MQQLQDEWKQFTDEHFPRLKGSNQEAKVVEEAREFAEETDLAKQLDEAADIIIVLMSWAAIHDLSLEAAVRFKMNKNFARTWEYDEERGVYKHVKQIA